MDPLYCRRYPPSPLQSSKDLDELDEGSRASDFTEVFGDDWCGEWKPSHDAVHTEDREGNKWAGVVFRRPDQPEGWGTVYGRD